MKRNYTTVLFDVDGTLVSLKAIAICLQLTLKKYGLRIMTSREIKEHVIGFTIQEIFPKFYPEARAKQDRFHADYLACYMKNHKRYSHLLPHVRETFDALRRRGIKIGIVTTKMHKEAVGVLRDYGLKYDALVAFDDVRHRKPSAEPVLLALKKLKSKPGETVFVGDHRFDMISAKVAGCTAVGVLTGAGTRHDFESVKADHVIRNVKEVLHIVRP